MSSVGSSPDSDRIGLEELIGSLELRNVSFFEVSARRWNADPDVDEKPFEEEDIDLKVMHKVQSDRVSVRCRMVFSGTEGRVVADAAALFVIKEDQDVSDSREVELDPQVLRAFISRVGIRIVFPYLREAVQESARKVRIKAPVLNLLRPGQLDIDEPEDPEF